MIKKNLIPILADRYVAPIRNTYWSIFGGKRAYCLCFHDVSYSNSKFAITPEEFYSLIISVKEKIVSIDGLRNTILKDPVVLTFDDGYESIISKVAPFLFSEKIPFTCYVTTGYLNHDSYLTEAQLKDVSQIQYCTIGSHMCTHSKTRQMTAEQIKKEWVNSKELLQELIGKEVLHAALPYGAYLSCSEKSKRIALMSGYNTIANTIATPFSKTNKEIFRYVYQKNNNRVERLIEKLSI